jgi:hypothetical protein
VPINHGVFREESINRKSLYVRFLLQTMNIVHHTSIALKTAVDYVKKSHSISDFESFPFSPTDEELRQTLLLRDQVLQHNGGRFSVSR